MTDQDPRYTETTRTTVKETDPFRPGAPSHVESVETTVRGRQTSTAAWWVAGVIALAAIIAVTWMVLATAAPQTDPADTEAAAIEQAIEDARRQGQIEGAQDTLATASAQTSAAIAAADRAAAEAAEARARALNERSQPDVVVIRPSEPQPMPAPVEPGAQPAPPTQ